MQIEASTWTAISALVGAAALLGVIITNRTTQAHSAGLIEGALTAIKESVDEVKETVKTTSAAQWKEINSLKDKHTAHEGEIAYLQGKFNGKAKAAGAGGQ